MPVTTIVWPPVRRIAIIAAAVAAGQPMCEAQIKPLGLVPATPNRALFDGAPARFYMYTNRSFEGRSSRPWQGGKYGYVRNPKRTKSGIVYTRFHEGIDIRPVERDRSGVPLDIVRSIAGGKVVYINASSGGSSYGRYIVVEHDWGYGKFYSLYAHLASIRCSVDQSVRPGTALGVLGYSGVGLDRTRAHLHLELNMMLSSRFTTWHSRRYQSPNKHGKFNGLNLAGIDIAGLYLKHREDPDITIPQFISRMGLYCKILVPNTGKPELLRDYPWLGRNMALADDNPSWELALSSSGVPLALSPSERKVSRPTVSWVRYSSVPHTNNTRGRLSGSGTTASLTSSGSAYIQLLMGAF